MKGWLILACVAIVAIFGSLCFNSWSRHQVLIAALNYAEKTEPSLNALCGSYFEWSTTTKERVPGMEDHCGAKP